MDATLNKKKRLRAKKIIQYEVPIDVDKEMESKLYHMGLGMIMMDREHVVSYAAGKILEHMVKQNKLKGSKMGVKK